MPGNKIGKLKAGQGLRRILAQRRGGWRGLARTGWRPWGKVASDRRYGPG